jgi:hypothetical protein
MKQKVLGRTYDANFPLNAPVCMVELTRTATEGWRNFENYLYIISSTFT